MGDRGVRVICRVRPQNNSEISRQDTVCTIIPSNVEIKVREHKFLFDRVFGMETNQGGIFCVFSLYFKTYLDMYGEVGSPVVQGL